MKYVTDCRLHGDSPRVTSMPILEPEVDTHSADKAQSEALLKEEILKQPPPGRCSFCVNE